MGNKIHHTAIIDDRVEIGENNEIGPYSILYGPINLGNDNFIGPHVAIGTPGQDTRNPRYDSSNSLIQIGNRNIIREFTAIQKPCYKDVTKIGSDVFLMQSVHIPHDAIIEDFVVITPMVVLSGITNILEGANIGVGASINQYCVVGQYSIVGMGSALLKNLKPFSRYIPNKPLSVNEYAIKKYGFEDFKEEIKNYVIYDIMPESVSITSIVDKYNKIVMDSVRESY